MSLNKEVEVLRDVPLFSKIDHTKLKLLAFTSENLIHLQGWVSHMIKVRPC